MTDLRPLAGTEICVRRMGHGPVPMLVLHCGQGSGRMWAPVLTGLGDAYTALLPDMPGHGRSAPWPAGRDVHDVVTEIAAALVEPGAHVVGHSFGATVALRLALARPGVVSRLTLIEPVLFAAARGTPAAAAHDAEQAPFDAAVAQGDMPLAARLFNRMWGAGVRWDTLPEKTRARMTASIPFILASTPALADDRAGILAPGGLEALDIPVTLLRGADTVGVIAAIHAALCARLPRARDHAVPGAGHMLPVTHPETFAGFLV